MSDKQPEAWVRIPTSEELLAAAPKDRDQPIHPYDFASFFPAMGRLVMAHGRIGAKFAPLFNEIMFSEEGALTRAEREMIASVAAAGQDCHY
jgi:hypothetical protein